MLTRTKRSFAGMNFLAHAYLSFNHPQILVGNMISDFVKGSARFGFSGNIAQGIILHRNIDAYTDQHPSVKKAAAIFKPSYRLYSYAIIDILFDHYLANDNNCFTEGTLAAFTRKTYHDIEKHSSELPLRFIHVFGYMRTEDWLYHYHSMEGIRKSLEGLVRRSAYMTCSDTAFQLFGEHYHAIKSCYDSFMPDVKQFAKQRMEQLVT